MCGIFGMVRGRNWSEARRSCAAEALITLGILAEERGRDAAGLAMRTSVEESAWAVPRRDIARFRDVRVGDWHVVKTRGPFRNLDLAKVAHQLVKARLVLGHTRWSTQGGDRLVNASPLVVGPLIGTHNGDIASHSVRSMVDRSMRISGDTDTEVLLAAIASTGGGKAAIRAVLASMHGRAALAWVDQRRPHGVWLARAALSPLAIAGDRHGGLWWASNPQWLREVDEQCNLGLSQPRMLREGTLLRVLPKGGEIQVQSADTFVPLARRSDVRVAELAAWRGFRPADKRDDRALARHRVVSSFGSRFSSFGSEDLDFVSAGPPRGEENWDDEGWDVA